MPRIVHALAFFNDNQECDMLNKIHLKVFFNFAALAAAVQGVQRFHIHFASAMHTHCTSVFVLQSSCPAAARVLGWLALSEVEVQL